RPQHARRDGLALGVERGTLASVPLLQAIRAPAEALVEVAEVARVRAAGLERDARVGARDAMAADRLREAVGRVRHVAGHAVAAARARAVVRVRGELLGRAELLVALHARGRPVHAGPELIRGPAREGARVAFRRVQLVTREAAQLAAPVAR